MNKNLKLIILYILSIKDNIKHADILNYLAKKTDFDYLTCNETIFDLYENRLITSIKNDHTTTYSILEDGMTIVKNLAIELPVSTMEDIKKYVNSLSDVCEQPIISTFTFKHNGKYAAHIVVPNIIDTILYYDNESSAVKACTNFENNFQNIINLLENELLKD